MIPRQSKKVDPFYHSASWRELRSATLERDNNVCQYCGHKGTQADHIHPRKRGGADILLNLVCSCSSCNRVAGQRTFPDFRRKRIWIRAARGIEVPGAIPGELPADTKRRLAAKKRPPRRLRKNTGRGKIRQ